MIALRECGTAAEYRRGCRCPACRKAIAEHQKAARHKRRAERRETGGRLIHPRARHGTLGGYDHYGCRCGECSEAERAWRRAHRAGEPHGTPGRYQAGCRCEPCRRAESQYVGRLRATHSAERIRGVDGSLIHPCAPHGTAHGYNYYACRCSLCAMAMRDYEATRHLRKQGIPVVCGPRR
jgi:hypothetical protein